MDRETTFYTKEGDDYIPVKYHDDRLLSSFTSGATLVVKKDNATMYRRDIEVDTLPLYAAAVYMENTLRDIIAQSSKAKFPKDKVHDTPAVLEAWDNLQTAMGDKLFYLQYPSIHDIAEEISKALQQEASALLQYPAVKHAYENFLTACRLCKDS